MAHSIMFGNSKGGVGKTTCCVNVADILSKRGEKVLLIDMDPQGHCSMSLGKNPLLFYNTVADVLTRKASIEESIVNMGPNFDLLPSNIGMFDIEDELRRAITPYFLLDNALRPIKAKYDFLIIDTPPNIGTFVLNGIIASEIIIVPIDSSFLGVEGFLRLKNILTKDIEPALKRTFLIRILITMFDSRTRMSKDVREDVAENFGQDTVLTSFINRNTDVQRAIAKGITLRTYAEKEKKTPQGLIDYESFVDELLALIQFR
jgi:chromosome partitioning protein